MKMVSKNEAISFLLRRKFPLYFLDQPKFVSRIAVPVEQVIKRKHQEVSTYEEQLKSMSNEDLVNLFDEEQEKEGDEKRNKEIEDEQKIFFNNSNSNADFEYWSKASYWSIDEAVALSFGKNPDIVNSKALATYRRISKFAEEYARLVNLARRAVAIKLLTDPTIPGAFLMWAKRNDIHYPPELEEQVTARGHNLRDWQSLHDEKSTLLKDQMAMSSKLLAERDETLALAKKVSKQRDDIAEKLRMASSKQASVEKPIREREQVSLLKMVIGMAVGYYGWDPIAKRSKVISEIKIDLDKAGISLDEDTIRKWLRVASEHLPPQSAKGLDD